MKSLLTGNEAVALGAYEAGVFVATGYPGTPATEIIETISRYPEVYAEWSVNEKTALEFASGVSLSGKRALIAMKHVGLNVASDPLISLAYTGVNGGLVIAVSDDPGMWSSQNEQDSRLYGLIANIPVLEPSDSQEAYIFTKRAFDISERFDLPILLRLTRAISHTSSIVNFEGERREFYRQYTSNPKKNVLIPPYTSKQRLSLQSRMEIFRQEIPSIGLNSAENKGTIKGIITSGISYQYVKETFPDVSVFKIGIVYPLNIQEIKKFSESCIELFIVEESSSFIEDMLKARGIEVRGKANGLLPETGELNSFLIKEAFQGNYIKYGELCRDNHAFLCPGCPYIGVFSELHNKSIFIGGDIGCYTLAVHTYPNVIDTTLCMGSGISQAAGYSISKGEKAIGVIGDSTFFHSGIPAVLNAMYQKADILIIILDNHTTSMTGGQPHIGTGKGLRPDKKRLLIEDILYSCGVESVKRIGAYDLHNIKSGIMDSLLTSGISAIIIDGECAVHKQKDGFCYIEEQECNLCNSCLSLGCSAIIRDGNSYKINDRCNGCGLCIQVCEQNAIKKKYINSIYR